MAPPLETLLTQFRKLQPSPLEVGDHLIVIGERSLRFRFWKGNPQKKAFYLHRADWVLVEGWTVIKSVLYFFSF